MADFFTVVAVPCAGFFHELGVHAQFDDFAFAGNAFAVQDVKFSLFERRRYFVFDDFDAGFRTDDFVAFFDGAGAAYV